VLEEIRKHTPDRMVADVQALDKVLHQVGGVASHINDRSRESEQKQMVVRVHQRLLTPSDERGALLVCGRPALVVSRCHDVGARAIGQRRGAPLDQP
jgi:hypothetical protein